MSTGPRQKTKPKFKELRRASQSEFWEDAKAIANLNSLVTLRVKGQAKRTQDEGDIGRTSAMCWAG